MSGSGVSCRAQDGGLQQLLDRIQTVRIRRRIHISSDSRTVYDQVVFHMPFLLDRIHGCTFRYSQNHRLQGRNT